MTTGASAQVTRKSGTSFYYAFRLLPAAKRRAIFALYSFCRVVDDCVDEEGGQGEACAEHGRLTYDDSTKVREWNIASRSFPEMASGRRSSRQDAPYSTR